MTLSWAAYWLLFLPLLAVPLCWWTILTPARWLALLFGAALLLPPLPFRLGDSGPHPALAFAALGLFAGILRLSEWRFRLDALQAWMGLYFLVLLAGVPLALVYSGLAIAAGTLARVLLFGIAVYVFFYVRAGPGRHAIEYAFRQARWLFWAGVASALFACLDFYFQFPAPAGYGPQFIWLESGVYRRAQGVFYEASTLGNLCAFFLVMIAVAFTRPRAERPLASPALVAGGAAFSVALVLSYSRASLINVAAALLALAVVRGVRLRRLAAAAALCAAGALLSLTLFPAFAQAYWLRIEASFQYFFSSPEGVLSGRLANWQALGRFLAEQPWHALLGVGYKTLPYSSVAGRPLIADNMYLSMLAETGVVGLAALLALSAAILRAAWRASRGPDPGRAFFGTWMFCFWVGQMFQMLSGDLLTYWRVLPVYFWTLAAACA